MLNTVEVNTARSFRLHLMVTFYSFLVDLHHIKGQLTRKFNFLPINPTLYLYVRSVPILDVDKIDKITMTSGICQTGE